MPEIDRPPFGSDDAGHVLMLVGADHRTACEGGGVNVLGYETEPAEDDYLRLVGCGCFCGEPSVVYHTPTSWLQCAAQYPPGRTHYG